MPLYEYRCRRCDTRFEVLQAVGAGSEGVTCPVCNETERVEKQFSTFSGGTRERGGASFSPAPSCGGGRSGFG